MSEDLVPLHSHEAEMSTLGSMILSDAAAEDVCGVLTPSAFHRSAHQVIFVALQRLVQSKSPIDLVTLKAELLAREKLGEVGGDDYLIQIAEFVPSAANALHYAQIVLDKWTLRRLEQVGRDIVADAYRSDDRSADAKLGAAEARIADLSASSGGTEALTDWRDIDISQAQSGVSTGHSVLDGATGVGWVASQNNVVSAYTKGGKTSMMIGATRTAVQLGYRVVYATFADLDASQLKRRTLKADCGVGGPSPSGVKNAMFEDAKSRHNDPFDVWANLKVYEARKHGRTVEQFISKMRGAYKSFPFQVVFIDYAQKLQSSQFKPGEKTGMLEYASDFIEEHLARRYGIPVVIGSQLTKGLDGTWVTKYARALEEDAGFVVRTVVEDDLSARVEVPLNRFGPKGLVFDASWNQERVQFENLRIRP